MKSFLKYWVVPVVTFLSLFILTIVLLPVVINVQNLVPAIEHQVTQRTGRSFSIGSDVSVSLFPWLSVSFSDLQLGNPAGFSNNDFLKIESFEGRVELLPLLSRKIKINRFVVGGVQLHLETNSHGDKNWGMSPAELHDLLQDVTIDLFAITNGSLTWTDLSSGHNRVHTAEDFMILANNFNIDKSFSTDAKASMDGKVIAFNGEVGPFSSAIGNKIQFNLAFDFAEAIQGRVKGKIAPAGGAFDMNVKVSPFVPAALGAVFAAKGDDHPAFLEEVNSLEMVADLHRSPGNLEIHSGVAKMDDSNIIFSASLKEEETPHLDLSLKFDRFNLATLRGLSGDSFRIIEADQELHEYLRSLDINASLQSDELRFNDAVADRFQATLVGSDGIWNLEPVSFAMNGGEVSSKVFIDLRQDLPETRMALSIRNVNISPLFSDVFALDLFSGQVTADGSMGFFGLSRKNVISSLTGKADLHVENGSFAGFDLADIYSGGKTRFVGFTAGEAVSVRTNFSVLDIALIARNGVFESSDAKIILKNGSAEMIGFIDLNRENIDLQFINPVAVIDNMGNRGVPPVLDGPVVLTGSFLSPVLTVGGAVIPQNGTLVANAVEVENLVAQKVPSPADEDLKNSIGKTLIDPLVVAERIGLAMPAAKNRHTEQKVETDSVSKIYIHPLRQEMTM